jgi:hypothetical protein
VHLASFPRAAARTKPRAIADFRAEAFRRLEAEGAARVGPALKELHAAIGKLSAKFSSSTCTVNSSRRLRGNEAERLQLDLECFAEAGKADKVRALDAVVEDKTNWRP